MHLPAYVLESAALDFAQDSRPMLDKEVNDADPNSVPNDPGRAFLRRLRNRNMTPSSCSERGCTTAMPTTRPGGQSSSLGAPVAAWPPGAPSLARKL